MLWSDLRNRIATISSTPLKSVGLVQSVGHHQVISRHDTQLGVNYPVQ